MYSQSSNTSRFWQRCHSFRNITMSKMNQQQYPGAPPPYGMNPPPPPGPTVVVQPAMNYGNQPVQTQCPHCQAHILTRVDHVANVKTHLFALLLFFVFCPCVCVPYCCDSCQTANHYCPKCGQFLGASES